MSATRMADGIAPRHRQSLPRKRRPVRFDLRPTTYTKLIDLAEIDELGRSESAVSVVERLILSAYERLAPASK